MEKRHETRLGRCLHAAFLYPAVSRESGLFSAAAGRPRLQFLEEVVPLVVYEDECREVLHGNLPDGFHAQFGVFHALNALDAAL